MTVALVTGAAAGIGRGVALGLAQAGHDVAVHFRSSREAAEDVVAEIRALGRQSFAVAADVTDLSQVTALIGDTVKTLGRLDVLVNVVGNYHAASLEAFPLDQWHDMFASNLHSTYYLCTEALPFLRVSTHGRIVNFGCAGTNYQLPRTHTTAYMIAKTGVVLLTKALAEQEAKHGVTANIVAPGVIETSRSQPVQAIAMQRVGTLEEVTQAVLFLVSPASSYITGQTIEVAGGWHM